MNPLLRYINSYVSTPISKENFKNLQSYFIRKKLIKKQLLLQRGDVCTHFAFVVKGALRQYYIDERGVQHSINLFTENWWAGDRESFVRLTPSIYCIDALEDCELLLITRENVLHLCREFPAFNELLLKLDEQNSISVQRRITSISFSAEKRYRYFVKNYPFFINRIPQHIIASYIGVTKDTLSRLRRKLDQ